MTARGITITAIALGAVAACSSFGGTSSENPANDAGSAPVPDASTPAVEAGPSAADAGDCPSGAELCDDFERGVIDATRWVRTSQNNGTVTLVDATPGPNGASPNHAVQATRTATNGRADVFIGHQFDRTTLPVTIASRAWVNVQAPVKNGIYAVTLSAINGQETAPFIHSALADPGGNWLIESAIGSSYQAYPSNVPWKLDTWTCLELVATFDDPQGHLSLFIDGQLSADKITQTYDSTTLNQWGQFILQLGVTTSEGQSTETVLVDNAVNVVLPKASTTSTPIIGCN